MSKCLILHLVWGNPKSVYKLRDERLKNSPAERGVRFLVEGKFSMSQQRTLAAQRSNCPPGVHQAQHCHWERGDLFFYSVFYGMSQFLVEILNEHLISQEILVLFIFYYCLRNHFSIFNRWNLKRNLEAYKKI